MTKYRKKPIEIEAVKWDGKNYGEVFDFCTDNIEILKVSSGSNSLVVSTLEGRIIASQGDYIIKGIQGEIYPCKPDIFEQTYEKVK